MSRTLFLAPIHALPRRRPRFRFLHLSPLVPIGQARPAPSLFSRSQSRHNATSSISSSRLDPLTRLCPSCSRPIPHPSSPCPECRTLIALPPDLSHHALLLLSSPVPSDPSSSGKGTYDVPAELSALPARGFDVDVRDARTRMLRRQGELHPDRYGGTEGELAKELSGRVNGAYAVLSDPVKRVEYILDVHGLPTEETESLSDPIMLAEILEAREELEYAETEGEVDQIRQTNAAKVDETIQQIKDALNENPANLTGAKALATSLKYWQGLEDAAKEWKPRPTS